jgi:glycosyltransferase involved in cell wall biosynthesis
MGADSFGGTPLKVLMMGSGTPNSSLTHRLASLGSELARRGHHVSMIAPSLDRHSGWQLDNPPVLKGIHMIYPWQFRTKSFLLNLLPYLVSASTEALRQSADVIYVAKPTPATLMAVVPKWLKRTPIVLDMDDLGAEVMRLEGHPAAIWRLVAACEWLLARQATAIVAASRFLEREFTSRFVARKPVLRLPNGVDPVEFRPGVSSLSRPPHLIFFAMLGRSEILRAVLEALPAVVQKLGSAAVHLEVLGDGPARAELEAVTQGLGLAENVLFRGWTTFAELSRYVATGDIGICIVPNDKTVVAASSQKVFQYHALGLATIVTAVGDLPEYVEGGRAGVVVPVCDRAALERALVDMLCDPAQCLRLATRGRMLAETRYAWSVLGVRLEEFLEAVRLSAQNRFG